MTSRYPVAFLVFSLIIGAVCVRLGVWQLDRLAGRRAASAAALEQRSLPAVDFRALLGPGENRRVVASGQYDFDREIVLRGRARDGVPGVEVVTPLRLAGSDTAVLVLRGYVPSADAISYAAVIHREPDTAALTGVAMPVPNDSAGAAPARRNSAETWRRLDLASLRARLPYPVAPLYIIADSPSTVSPAPRRSRPPTLDDGPHLNYAIQWFAFASIAFGGAAALWWRRRQDPAGWSSS
jgi:surfeit locus 1 family protein